MNKKVIGIVIVCIILIIVVCCIVFTSCKISENEDEDLNVTEETNIVEENTVEENEIEEEELEENIVEENVAETETVEETTSATYSSTDIVPSSAVYETDTEVGTTDKKEQAIALVKEKWGEDSTVTFRCDSVTSSGEYIIAVVSSETASVKNYFRVNLENQTVEVEY